MQPITISINLPTLCHREFLSIQLFHTEERRQLSAQLHNEYREKLASPSYFVRL